MNGIHDVRRGCIGKDAQILSTRDGKSAPFLLADTKARCRSMTLCMR